MAATLRSRPSVSVAGRGLCSVMVGVECGLALMMGGIGRCSSVVVRVILGLDAVWAGLGVACIL